MPYLSWTDGTLLVRHALEGDCCLGRDVSACEVARASDATLSRRHALISQGASGWWIRDLQSVNGTLLNGLQVPSPGGRLEDGDVIRMGDWTVTFTEGFPGLDGVQFAERVGNLFEEARPEPAQAVVLIHGLELLQRSVEALLLEGTAEKLIQGVLTEALRLLRADRGFLVMLEADGTWRRVVQIGEADERLGLSQTILQYVATHRVAVLSNAPLADPRFSGRSIADMHRGALLCAPLALESQVLGMLYLDRQDESRPFTRFDLSLFQSFVRLGSVAIRHARLAQGALGEAEAVGELQRLKRSMEAHHLRTQASWLEMAACLRWLQATCGTGADPGVVRSQVGRLAALVERGLREEGLDAAAPEVFGMVALEQLASRLREAWGPLSSFRNSELRLEGAPEVEVWTALDLAVVALQGITDPILFQLDSGSVVSGTWVLDAHRIELRLAFPKGAPAPQPEPWTLQALRDANLSWKWANQTLTLTLPRVGDTSMVVPEEPLLGLISMDQEMAGLFERVAQVNGCTLVRLEEEPPRVPMPVFRYLVLDVEGVADPGAVIRAYRNHPGFALVPILAVKVPEERLPQVMAAGATDWLQEGFRWEALHHRLAVLREHENLQRKALASERLDSFKQMAGTLKHEINNPLAVISMQVELLQRKYLEEPKLAKIGEMVERIRVLVQVLQRMREAPQEDYPGGGTILKV